MKRQPITNPDTSNVSQDYWDSVLTSYGLSAERGRAPRKWINRGTDLEELVRLEVHVGRSQNLEGVEEQEIRRETGRVTPTGRGPDAFEQHEQD